MAATLYVACTIVAYIAASADAIVMLYLISDPTVVSPLVGSVRSRELEAHVRYRLSWRSLPVGVTSASSTWEIDSKCVQRDAVS